jgi:epoxide hydrolase
MSHRPSPPLGERAEDVSIRRYSEQLSTVARWTEFERGGHFAALEVPDLFVDDLRGFFATLR